MIEFGPNKGQKQVHIKCQKNSYLQMSICSHSDISHYRRNAFCGLLFIEFTPKPSYAQLYLRGYTKPHLATLLLDSNSTSCQDNFQFNGPTNFLGYQKKWGMEIGNQVGLGTLLLDVLGIAPLANQDLFVCLQQM